MNAIGLPDPAAHATPRVLSRARAYEGRVGLLSRTDRYARCTMVGTHRYEQTLRWSSEGSLEVGRCTCPYARRGAFCKHLVAALRHLAATPATGRRADGDGDGLGTSPGGAGALVDTSTFSGLGALGSPGAPAGPGALAGAGTPDDPRAPSSDSLPDSLRAALDGIEDDAAREQFTRLAAALLETVASPAPGPHPDAEAVAARLARQVRAAFSPGRYPLPERLGALERLEPVDIDDRPGRLRVLSTLLDQIDLDRARGGAAAILPSAQRAAVRIRAWQHSGSGVDADEMRLVHRGIAVAAAVMHDAGVPGPEIAAWVLRTQLEGGGVPHEHLLLPDAAWGDGGLAAYRELVAAQGDPVRDPSDDGASDDDPAGCPVDARDVLAAIVCELAIRDGDPGRAIAAAAVIDDDDDTRTRMLLAAAARLDHAGHDDAVIARLWELLESDPTPDVAAVLHDRLAERGRWDASRERFWDLLEASGTAWAALETALRIGAVDRAWALAEEHGAGWHGEDLVSLQPPQEPGRCVRLLEDAVRDRLDAYAQGGSADDVLTRLHRYRRYLETAEPLRHDTAQRHELEERYETFVDELLSATRVQDGLGAVLVEAGML